MKMSREMSDKHQKLLEEQKALIAKLTIKKKLV
jgi:hypothetical protein